MSAQPSLVDWLAVGDLRSDGFAPQVAALVIENPLMLVDLVQAMVSGSDIVHSWAISSLCLLGRAFPGHRISILENIAPLTHDASIDVRHRLSKAAGCLMDPELEPPRGWKKNQATASKVI